MNNQPLTKETSHAIAQAMCLASRMKNDEVVVINVSGSVDKDLDEVVKLLEI